MLDQQSQKRIKFLINTAYFAVAALIIYLAYKYALGWMMPFIIGYTLAAMTNPIIRRLTQVLKIKRHIVSVIVTVFVYTLVGLLLWLLIELLVSQLRLLFTGLPAYAKDHIVPAINSIGDWITDNAERLPEEWQGQIEQAKQKFVDSAQEIAVTLSRNGLSLITGWTGKFPSALLAVTVTIVASFFISMQYNSINVFIMSQLPDRARRLLRDIKSSFAGLIWKTLRARMIILLILAAEMAPFLFLITGKWSAIYIAFVIAMFDFLPVVGVGTILLPWSILQLIDGNIAAGLGLLALYVATAALRNVCESKILGDQLGINPLISLLSLYLGFVLMGFAGALILPIVAQILLTLHQDGKIKLYREAIVGANTDDDADEQKDRLDDDIQ